MTQYLTRHFTLEEFTNSQTAIRHGIDNTPNDLQLENINMVANKLEQIRTLLFDKAIYISSGYRCPKLNEIIGGSKLSAHLYGLAVDFVCPAFGDPKDICIKLEPYLRTLEIDQLILEYNSWVHVGWSQATPRYQCLTIDRDGTKIGIV